jgi:hypothetical protein
LEIEWHINYLWIKQRNAEKSECLKWKTDISIKQQYKIYLPDMILGPNNRGKL